MPEPVKMISIKVNPREQAAFERVALIEGLKLSTWIRRAARKAAEESLVERGERVPFAPEATEA
jgi:uncharacterized protein (DUF1778 family)